MRQIIIDEGKVGSKGELYPSKKIRKAAGLKKHMKVRYIVINGRLIIERIMNPIELLEKEPKVTITYDEHKQDRKELSKVLEK